MGRMGGRPPGHETMAAETPEIWKPSGVVTLTTDFGLQDPYAGIMQGVVLSIAPKVRVVDLTHLVPPQDVAAGAFYLMCSWRWFPPGTVHAAVVDPGVGSARGILVAIDRGHVFLAPDNGLLGPVLSREAEIRVLDEELFSLPERSATFHGRDVFAPAAARMAAGFDPAEAGEPADDWRRADLPQPVVGETEVRGSVLFADHFGNLIANVRPSDLGGAGDGWRASIGGRSVPLGRTYAEVTPGHVLALVGSWGWYEVAVRDGSAAEVLGLGPGAEVSFCRERTP